MTLGTASVLPHNTPAIGDLLRRGPVRYSFEFFPPKTPKGQATLWRSIRRLEALRPDYVSVTYGAGGSTRATTVETTDRIAAETTLLPLAHCTAVDHSVAELRNLIGHFVNVGVRNILAVRGDPPGDPQGRWVQHPEGFLHARELVELIKSSGDFSVGVAAFPEGHPRSPDWDTHVRHFVEKCRSGADFAITQIFFDWQDYVRLRDAVVAAGCDIPIVPGVMPVTNVNQIERFAQLTGMGFPPQLAQRLRREADSPEAVRAIGVEVATELSQKLIAEGAPGIHFITLNHSDSTRKVWANLVSPQAKLVSHL
ncbi:methylenetetrahydrofolate reductase [NAD(P)H] [Natronoglycomyces albus]|uniref:Methylenetetrahydrofolate reductase n=1 Tax=Natronoglycomyces albus TaxID=2811108 RepID=A0A895XLR8_9ACTN|nr:methylenetetrahydrofolate reductase [NAD(P)H] [Natronoglycomyces albus]QSB03895.1 methylenetetrahydrofolate reductase [NAD(P)H] [Natronoglycomyces albus]